MPFLSKPIPVDQLVAHKRPMLMVDDLVAYSEDHGVVRAEVHPENPLLVPGSLAHLGVLIELVAQAAAAHNGYKCRLHGGGIGWGFLVGISDFTFEQTVRAGDHLEVSAEREQRVMGFDLVLGEVRRAGEVLARGHLKLMTGDGLKPAGLDGKQVEGEIVDRSRAVLLDDDALPPPSWFEGLASDCSSIPVLVPESARIVRGHFPRAPLLPAAYVTALACRVAARSVDRDLQAIRSVRKAKFHRPIQPGIPVYFCCRPLVDADPRLLRMTVSCNGATAATVIVQLYR